MPVAIMAAATVAGSAIAANGAKSAANTQANAANRAADLQQQQYEQTRQDQTVNRVSGQNATNALNNFYGLPTVNADGTSTAASPVDYNKLLSTLPGYQFQVDQGGQQVQRNLAARGLLQSGAAGKALQQYGQGVAQNYAGQYVSGLQGLAGQGQTANNATAQAGAYAANGQAQAIQNGAAGVASGQVGAANAWQQGFSGLAGLYGQYQGYQQQQQYGAYLKSIAPAATAPPVTFNPVLNNQYSFPQYRLQP